MSPFHLTIRPARTPPARLEGRFSCGQASDSWFSKMWGRRPRRSFQFGRALFSLCLGAVAVGDPKTLPRGRCLWHVPHAHCPLTVPTAPAMV